MQQSGCQLQSSKRPEERVTVTYGRNRARKRYFNFRVIFTVLSHSRGLVRPLCVCRDQPWMMKGSQDFMVRFTESRQGERAAPWSHWRVFNSENWKANSSGVHVFYICPVFSFSFKNLKTKDVAIRGESGPNQFLLWDNKVELSCHCNKLL